MKPKKCKHCKEPFMPQRPLQFLCGPHCAWKYAEKQKRDKAAKDWKVEKAKLTEKLMTLGQYEQFARVVFQKWVRLRDKNLPCVSCGDTKTDKWDAGHYLKAELYSGLIFHEDNCWKQCKRCNHYLGGNELNYREGLIKRIGEAKVLELEASKDRLRVYKYTKDQLVNIREKYKQKIKQLSHA